MGKKRITILGDTQAEEALKKEREVAREQKRLREGSSDKVHIAGQKGGEKIKSMESVVEQEAATVAQKLKEANEPQVKETTKKTAPRKRGKGYLTAKIKVDPSKIYSIEEAITLLRTMPQPRFDATVELHINCIERTAGAQVELPFATGKARVAAIADEKTLADIEAGKIKFDVLFASPAQMGKLAKLAKILGPKGLMPNPKNGTVVENPEKALKEFGKTEKISLKSEAKAPIVHTIVGKMKQEDNKLVENTKAILGAIKTENVKSVFIKSTMSPSIKISLQ